eukprot:3931925-Rhodomonas_salina.2
MDASFLFSELSVPTTAQNTGSNPGRRSRSTKLGGRVWRLLRGGVSVASVDRMSEPLSCVG